MPVLEYSEIKKKLARLQAGNDTDKEERKQRALNDLKYFVEYYLPHYLDGNTEETSKFRNWLYNEAPTLAKKNKINLFLAYRGSAKTTLAGRSMCMWRALKKLSRYTIHISDGAELATENTESIKLEFEENKRLIKDFDIERGWRWKAKAFIVKLDGTWVKFQAFGTGTRMRGKNFMSIRPEDIYLDDLENDVNIDNEEQRVAGFPAILMR